MDKKFIFKKIAPFASAAVIVMPVILGAGQVFAATGGKTADQAITWVKSKVGTGIDYDKVYGNQCVDLIKAYYSYLGQSAQRGNGCDYAKNTLPSGWKRIKGGTPQKGDVLVYTGGYGGYGHVAIYESDYSTYHQNFNSHSYVERVTIKYNGRMGVTYWGVIRPDFKISTSTSGTSSNNTVLNGLVKVSGKWGYYTNNKLNTQYTGMAKNAYGWWYIKNGRIDTTYTGMAKNAYGWWYIKKGKLDTTYTGMAKNKYGWWYIKKGKLDLTFTGIAKNQYGLWYMQKGKLNTKYSGTVNYGGKKYKVVSGKATLVK